MDPEEVGKWRWSGIRLHAVYRVKEEDLGRVGNCWMKGRLLVDDLVIPIDQSGDSFFTYLLLEGGSTRGVSKVGPGGKHSYRLCASGIISRLHRSPGVLNMSEFSIPGVEFGAYALGTLHDEQPTEREYHLLRAGEPTAFSDQIDVEKAMQHARDEAARESKARLDRAVENLRKTHET